MKILRQTNFNIEYMSVFLGLKFFLGGKLLKDHLLHGQVYINGQWDG